MNYRSRVQAFNALFIENDKTFLTIQNKKKIYRIQTVYQVQYKKKNITRDTKVSIDLKSRLHFKEIRQKQDNKAQPVLSEKHSAYVTYDITTVNQLSHTL